MACHKSIISLAFIVFLVLGCAFAQDDDDRSKGQSGKGKADIKTPRSETRLDTNISRPWMGRHRGFGNRDDVVAVGE